MRYKFEELFPIIQELTDKYTGFESSSVTYETAQMLTQAVIYCIDESSELSCEDEKISRDEICYDLKSDDMITDAYSAYKTGYDKVLQKVYSAKEIYDEIIEEFCDYGCRCYYDTVIKGMPQFFLRYDPKFKPHEHLLLLDYPTIGGTGERSGVDAVKIYLENIYYEMKFLNLFDENAVIKLLQKVTPDYQELFMENIASQVMLTAIGCMIADKDVKQLELDEEDITIIKDVLGHNCKIKLSEYVRILLSKAFGEDEKLMNNETEYFTKAVSNFTQRVTNGINNNVLDNVFICRECTYDFNC